MPVSADIYSNIGRGVRPLEDPQNALLKALQVQGAQEQMQTQRTTRARTEDEYRRGVERSNRLQGLLSGDYADDEARADALLKGGFFKESEDFLKGRAEVAGKRATVRKTDADTTKTLTETDAARYKQHLDLLGAVQDPESFKQWVQLGMSSGAIKEGGNMLLQAASQVQTPQQFQQLQARVGMGLKDYLEKNAPKFSTVNAGNAQVTTGRGGLFGEVMPELGQTTTINQSPDSVASNLTSSENNRRSTGAQYAIAAAGREQANATRDAASITAKAKAAQDAEMRLADDYRTESKGWAETATAIGMVREALKTADKNPGSALAAGTKFMKLLDPTSVVRETELGMALNASGWFDRATNVANQLQSGRVMTTEQVKNLRAAGDALYEEARKAQLQIDAAFEARAKAYGANPANVITDRGQRSPRIPTPAADGWGAVKVN